MRPVQPDDKLAAVVGSAPLPRSELTKKLWNYIKKHGLQDKTKRTQINADDTLRAVFNGKSQVSMFEMTKLVSGHIRYASDLRFKFGLLSPSQEHADPVWGLRGTVAPHACAQRSPE